MPMPAQNPFKQNVDNKQIGHDSDMNAYRDCIYSNLLGEVE
jgi:hypothetical protein